MKKYQYQILHYFPDLITGEFVNVGIVLYSPEEKQLYFQLINKYKRITDFFPGTNGKSLISYLRNLENNIQRIEEQLKNQLNFVKYPGVNNITQEILPLDDSALQFSEVKNGITLDFEMTVTDLFNSIVNRYESQYSRRSRSDEDAEHLIYREYFYKYGIANRLKKKTLETKNDTFDFDGWKNGVWHCYKAVSFDLLEDTSIKEKVYKWSGITSELLTSREDFKLFILALNPTHSSVRSNLLEFINNKLEFDDSKHIIKVVPEDQFENFSQSVRDEISSYE